MATINNPTPKEFIPATTSRSFTILRSLRTFLQITLHDLIAEIVGDAGQNPETGEGIQKLDEDTFLVSAQISLEEVNEQLELNLPLADNYNTLGGFLLEQWQKIPHQGEKLEYENLIFTIALADTNRLYQVTIHRQSSERIFI